jgi:excisionase family DNA binding protein
MTTSESSEIMEFPEPSVRHQVDVAACTTMSLAEAAEILGIHRTTAWSLHKRGEFPVPVLKVGSNLRVVRAHLQRFLDTGLPVEPVRCVDNSAELAS